MEPLRHDADLLHLDHLNVAQRVLALPVAASGLHWHPFGVYTIPLARRVADDGRAFSRRLHLWHPQGVPVGEASLYGVHTHSGEAQSHVLAGTLHHHLYDFEAEPDGIWRERLNGAERMATLRAHVWGPTATGVTHTLPAEHAHGVSKPPGWAISLFEQHEEGRGQRFTTWQRTDVDEEELVGVGPVPRGQVLEEARALIEEALFAAEHSVA